MQTGATRVRRTADSAERLAGRDDVPGGDCGLHGLVGTAQLTMLNADHAPARDHPGESNDAARNCPNRFADLCRQIDAPVSRQPRLLRRIKGVDDLAGYRW